MFREYGMYDINFMKFTEISLQPKNRVNFQERSLYAGKECVVSTTQAPNPGRMKKVWTRETGVGSGGWERPHWLTLVETLEGGGARNEGAADAGVQSRPV